MLLQIGAGTGLIFILRWFWWRINAWTEIAGMVVSFLVAFYLEIIRTKIGYEPLPPHLNLIIGVSITTAAWLFVTLVIKPADDETLRKFYRLIRPGGAGWNAVLQKAQKAGDPIEQTVLSATFLEEFCV
jgi:SSS family solute:Na+ symporter